MQAFQPDCSNSARAVRRRQWLAGGSLTLMVGLLSACGGGGVNSTPASTNGPAASSPSPSATPTPTPSASATPTPAPTASVAPSPTPTPTATATPTPAATFQTAEYTRSTGPSFHGALTGWAAGASGQGVTIGIVDSGIDTASPEFYGRISAASADLAGSRGLTNPDDVHGTNVAQVAAAARDNNGIMGMAFNATVLMYRADAPGSCVTAGGCSFDDAVIATGIDRAVSNGAKVINLSLGGSAPSTGVTAALARAASAGVVVVVAAGNDAAANPDAFAAALRAAGNGNVIIAGSVNDQSQLSSFSNKAGSEAQNYLAALGESICCTYQNGIIKVTVQNGQQYIEVSSGTSFAAPQIAGAAALLRQAFPNLTAIQVVSLLLSTARDAGASGTDAAFGRGILDIAAAFAPQGTTHVAGTTTQLVLNSTTAVTSPAMGDATQHGTGLTTMVLDRYGRAYRADLSAQLATAQLQQKLLGALGARTDTIDTGADRLAMAFTVDAGGHSAVLPWSGQLRLSGAEANQARVLAGRVMARLTGRTTLGIAYGQGADGITAQVAGHAQPAFLIASGPADDTGFARADQVALVLRRQLGAWGLSFSAERGDALNGAPQRQEGSAALRAPRAGTMRIAAGLDRQVLGIDAALIASWLAEDTTVLGGRFNPALGVRGADTMLIDARAGFAPAAGWRVNLALRQGFTRVRGGGLLAAGSNLVSNGWSVDVTRAGALVAGDSLGLRVAQPLRVAGGGLMLNLPVAYSYDTLRPTYALRQLNLAPQGREIDAELAWQAPLWGGAATTALYWRRDPGNMASVADDKGLALRWNGKF